MIMIILPPYRVRSVIKYELFSYLRELLAKLAEVKPTSTSILHGFCKLAELLAYECFRRFGTAQKLPKLGCDFADEPTTTSLNLGLHMRSNWLRKLVMAHDRLRREGHSVAGIQ